MNKQALLITILAIVGCFILVLLLAAAETTEAEQVIVKCLYCGCWHHEDSDVYYESIALS